ncbi:MAG: helix-turn-helix transcriptional regulator [Oscillospiraceae bacterium]|nr:helix-turn-helix transcriptional regulator [Oscillospiraceae bacterium]
MEEARTFGGYVREKRLAAGINLRKLAEILDIAPAYMSDIENDHRYPPEKDKIYKIAEALKMTKEETDHLFDLAAGNKKNSVSPDIADYIMEQNKSRVALRLARDKGLGEKEWEKIIRMLEENE